MYDQHSLMTRLITCDVLISMNSELFINFQSQTPLLPRLLQLLGCLCSHTPFPCHSISSGWFRCSVDFCCPWLSMQWPEGI